MRDRNGGRLFPFYISPAHPITDVHQNTKVKPDNQSKTVNKGQPKQDGFYSVYEKDSRKFYGGKTECDENPKNQNPFFHNLPHTCGEQLCAGCTELFSCSIKDSITLLISGCLHRFQSFCLLRKYASEANRPPSGLR